MYSPYNESHHWGYSINLNVFVCPMDPWFFHPHRHPHRQVSKTLDQQDVTYSLVCDTWRNNKKARTRKKLYIHWLWLVIINGVHCSIPKSWWMTMK
jgi:hypothetical protein